MIAKGQGRVWRRFGSLVCVVGAMGAGTLAPVVPLARAQGEASLPAIAVPQGAAGVIAKIDGGAQVQVRDASGAARNVAVGGGVFEKDHVTTGADQTVIVRLKDESEIAIGPGSEVEITAVEHAAEAPSSLLKLVSGLLHVAVNKIYSTAHPFVIQTDNGVMGVRGTEFVVEVEDAGKRSSLYTLEGRVAIARNFADLRGAKAARVVRAGYASGLAEGQTAPKSPARFNPKTLGDYLQTRAPVVLARIKARMGNNLARESTSKSGDADKSSKKAPPPPPPPKPKRTLRK